MPTTKCPAVSVIVPVYNVEAWLPETIASLQKQTFSDFEVIWVDDGSTDRSPELLRQAAAEDSRFWLLHQPHRGMGAARNLGFSAVSGQYTLFLDGDDLFAPELLRELYDAAQEAEADITACNFSLITPDQRYLWQAGVQFRLLPKDAAVFSWQDCPDQLLRLVHPCVWNKLYRTEFLREQGLRFEELRSSHELTFVAVSMAAAQRIAAVRKKTLVWRKEGRTHGSEPLTTGEMLRDARAAVESTLRQILALPQGSQLKTAAELFAVDQYIFALSHYVERFSDPEAESLYRMLHALLNQAPYSQLEKTQLGTELHQAYDTVRRHSYETMKDLISRRLVVSLTTYPKRIHLIPQVLDSIYSQTRQPEEILLWLAQEQFPGKEADLPQPLLALAAENRVTIRWCDDLKPHKKYFYALQEFPNDLVVTIDDDLLYSPDTLDCLYASYLQYPEAVSTVRAHLMVVDENQKILPYRSWIQETDTCLHTPSMQLMATNGAGVLHPPGRYRKETFDKQAILEHCLWADDLWMKAMQLISDIPVVLARSFVPLMYVPDSQEEALYNRNVRQGQNDVQFANTSRWLDQVLEPGILVKKLTGPQHGQRILGVEALAAHLDADRNRGRSQVIRLQQRLDDTEAKRKQADQEGKQFQQKYRQAEQKRNQAEERLAQSQQQCRQVQSQLQAQLRQTQQKLDRTHAALMQAEENAPIRRQLQNIGAALRAQRSQGGGLVRFAIKYCLYLLAWIPEMILAGLMCLLQNGGRAFVKQVSRKLLRK